MPILKSQRALREVRNLPFCYLCGYLIRPGDMANRDHVPPEALFEKDDRNFPLILRAHKRCNETQGPDDEKIGQLVGLKLGRAPRNHMHRKLDLRHATVGSTQLRLGVLRGFHIEGAIRRWLRGFHAALYRAPLPADALFAIQTPFPSGRVESRKLAVDELKPQHFLFVERIKQNRAAHSIDGIYCNNGKLRYECVWDQADNHGPWFCIFALNVYDWIDLGDINNFQPRGCAGAYWNPSASPPSMATKATRLVFTIPNRDATNPFGE